MEGRYTESLRVMREIDRAIEQAKSCQHPNTKFVEVEPLELSNGIVIDADTIEVCTAKYCGAIVRSGL